MGWAHVACTSLAHEGRCCAHLLCHPCLQKRSGVREEMCPERGLQHEAEAGSLSAETPQSVLCLLPNEAFHSSRCDLASYRLSGPLVPTPSALEVFTDALGFEPCDSPREGRGMLARGRKCRLSGAGPDACPESAHCGGTLKRALEGVLPRPSPMSLASLGRPLCVK